MMKIAYKPNYRFFEKNLPKGAIYGRDKYGPFACTAYKNHGTKAKPRLKVWRPDDDNTRKNWIKWVCSLEEGETAALILRFYQKNRDKCVIDWGDEAHEIAQKSGKARADFFGGGDGGEVPGRVRLWNTGTSSGRSLCYDADKNRTLDDIAREQKGQYYLW